MGDSLNTQQIVNELAKLSPEHQRKVLDFVQSLSAGTPKGVPGQQLLQFAGTIPADDIEAMKKAIEESCEQVDIDEW